MVIFLSDISHEHRGYKTSADRRRAMKLLRRRGYNVVGYRDTQAEFAVMISYLTHDIIVRRCKKLGMKVKRVVCSTMDASDFLGLPVPK